MRRILTTMLILSLAVWATPYSANAAIKPGFSCKKEGQVSTSSGMKYTCIKKSKKLIWDKGVKVASTNQGISVDKNLLTVDVTLPASFYEDEKPTEAELKADAAKKGYGNVKLNSDGSVTFRMTKAQHKKALDEMKKSVDDFIQESVDESPKVFRKITYNKNMTVFDVSVVRAEFEEDFAAGMIGLGIGILSAFYQMFNGSKDEPKTEIKLIDIDTGQVFDTQNWPIKD